MYLLTKGEVHFTKIFDLPKCYVVDAEAVSVRVSEGGKEVYVLLCQQLLEDLGICYVWARGEEGLCDTKEESD